MSFKKIFTIAFFGIFCISNIFATEINNSWWGWNNESKLSVNLTQVVAKKYPTLKAYVTVENEQGVPLENLSKKSFTAKVDGYENNIDIVDVYSFDDSDESVNYNVVFPENLPKATMNFLAQGIIELVDEMEDGDRISLYTMGSDFQPLKSISLLGYETTCIDMLEKDFKPEMILNYQVKDGQSPKIYDSLANLVQTISKKPEERKVLIVISDEKDNNSRISNSQFLNVIRNANVPMYMIGIRATSTETSLSFNDMAEASNGKYYYTPMIRDLEKTLSRIIDSIQDSYIITLRLSSNNDGLSHSLEVNAKTNNGSGSSKRDFYFSNKSQNSYDYDDYKSTIDSDVIKYYKKNFGNDYMNKINEDLEKMISIREYIR